MSGSDEVATAAEGVWRAAGAAAATQARLVVGADGMALVVGTSAGAVLAQAALGEVELSARVGSIPRHLTFPDGSDFETRDNDAIDRLRDRHLGRRGGIVHGLEAFRPRLVVFVAVAIGLCLLIYRFAVPALVEVAVWSTPPAVSDLMGSSVLVSLDTLVFQPTELEEDTRTRLQHAFTGLVATSGEMRGDAPSPEYVLHFRRGGQIGPNAFALPDGSVILTDELVRLAGDEEMVLGVLAHEIGHVEHSHSLRQIYRLAGVTALIMMIGGDIGAATEDLLIQGSALVALSHSRAAETEADRFSVELMHRAGHDPEAIARFFELLRDRFGFGSDLGILSTHPATQDRIDATRAHAREVAGKASGS
jgi:Zn-dependent protease with chaperone function